MSGSHSVEVDNLPQPELPPPRQAPAPPAASTPAQAPPAALALALALPRASDVAASSSVATTRPMELLMHKNRLQEHTQRSSIALPIYQTVNEGLQHAPMFRSTVLVDGETYTSSKTFSHRKAAEQDAAKLALECISKKVKDEGCPLIYEDTIFCKSILNEFAVKLKLERPVYTTVQPEGTLPVFVSSLVFNGVKYTGEAGKNKKEAEQLAARAVICSLLGNSGSGTILFEIIKSKVKLFDALRRVKDPNFGTANMNVHTRYCPGSSVSHMTETADVNHNVQIANTSHNVQSANVSHGVHIANVTQSAQTVNAPHDVQTADGRGTNNVQTASGTNNVQPASGTHSVQTACVTHNVQADNAAHNVPAANAIHNEQVANATHNEQAAHVTHNVPPSATHNVPPSATHDVPPSATHDLLPSATHIVLPNPMQKVLPSATHNVLPSATDIVLSSPMQKVLPSATHNVLPSATLGTSSRMLMPYHQFKIPKPEPPSETVDLSISFVPPVLEEPSETGPSTSKKRRKNKKLRADDQVSVPQPPTQTPPFHLVR